MKTIRLSPKLSCCQTLAWLFLVAWSPAWAEIPSPPTPNGTPGTVGTAGTVGGGQGQQQQQQQQQQGGIPNPIFDNRTFDLQSQSASPPGARTTPGGNTVYMAEEPNYNQAQYQSWLKACEHLKDTPQAYRDCFQAEKNADLRKNDNLIRGTGAPTRKSNAIPNPKDPYESLKED